MDISESRGPELLRPMYTRIPLLAYSPRNGVPSAQLRKVVAVGYTFRNDIASIIDVAVYQFVELLRRRVAGKVPEI